MTSVRLLVDGICQFNMKWFHANIQFDSIDFSNQIISSLDRLLLRSDEKQVRGHQ